MCLGVQLRQHEDRGGDGIRRQGPPIQSRPASGWEKGQVENQVGLVRERFFTPRLRFKNHDELNAWLLDKCIAYARAHRHIDQPDRSIWNVFEEERGKLVDYRSSFGGFHASAYPRGEQNCTPVDIITIARRPLGPFFYPDPSRFNPIATPTPFSLVPLSGPGICTREQWHAAAMEDFLRDTNINPEKMSIIFNYLSEVNGGGGGIRTHGTVSRTTVFKTVALNHSATPPETGHAQDARAFQVQRKRPGALPGPFVSKCRLLRQLVVNALDVEVHAEQRADRRTFRLPSAIPFRPAS